MNSGPEVEVLEILGFRAAEAVLVVRDLHFLLPFSPFVARLHSLLELLKVPYYFFIENAIVSLYLGVSLFLEHILFLNSEMDTFLLIFLRFYVMLTDVIVRLLGSCLGESRGLF